MTILVEAHHNTQQKNEEYSFEQQTTRGRKTPFFRIQCNKQKRRKRRKVREKRNAKEGIEKNE